MPAMDYEQLAYLYDFYVRADFDLQFFLDETRENSGKVLELMSGTGRVSLPLIEAGVNLTCVDSSKEMLDILRQKLQAKNLSAAVIEMDVCELSLDKQFDLIFIPFHSFAEIVARDRQCSALAKIYEHLSDNGRFICTLHNPNVRLKTADGSLKLLGKFALEEGRTLFLWSLANFDRRDRIVRGSQFYEIYDRQGQLHSKFFVDLEFYVHDRESFESLALEAGFQLESLYGSYAREEYDPAESPVIIEVLRK